MRAARAEGPQERGDRRDRKLAVENINTQLVFDIFWRLAGAIVLDVLAFVVWNIGTRSPGEFIADLRSALRNPRALLTGSVAFSIGLIFIAAALILVIPIASPRAGLVPLEIGTLIVALAIELLIGDDLRRLAGGRSRL